MGQMPTMGQIEAHQAVMWLHDCLVHLQVCGGPREALDVDAPLLIVEAEGLEGPPLAQQLDGVNVLVSAVVAGAGVALRVLVRHGRAQRIEHGARRHVLRGDQDDRLALTLDLEVLWAALGQLQLHWGGG